MCIEYNECHYGGMYNVYVKRIFIITEIVHMNAGVSSEKEEVKESQSQSRSVAPSLDTHYRVPGRGRHTRLPNTIGARSSVCFIILMARDPLASGFFQTLLRHCLVSLMLTGLVTQMTVPPQVLFLFFFVLIQSPGVLQNNTLLLVLPLRLSIVPLQLL